MPKYKYVDGVKYRVVPQSVLGYALVREDSDNSLPTGGTEGQVLTKASNTDYDVEWSTVESGECINFIMDIVPVPGSELDEYALADETKAEEYFNNLKDGKIPVLCTTNEQEGEYSKIYFTVCDRLEFSQGELGEGFSLYHSYVKVEPNKVLQAIATTQFGKLYSTGAYMCQIFLTSVQHANIS